MLRHLLAIIVITGVSVWSLWTSPNHLVPANESLSNVQGAFGSSANPSLPSSTSTIVVASGSRKPANETTLIRREEKDRSLDGDLYKAWEPYRDEIYRNVQLTAEEINRLNEITAALEKDHETYVASANRFAKSYPQIRSVVVEKSGEFVQKVFAREAILLLGKERYEYLIKAKRHFFESYKKKTGKGSFISEW